MNDTFLVAPAEIAERWRDPLRAFPVRVARSIGEISGKPDTIVLIDQAVDFPARLGNETSLLWQGIAERPAREALRAAARRAGFDRRNVETDDRNSGRLPGLSEERYFRTAGGPAEACFQFLPTSGVVPDSVRRDAVGSFLQKNLRRTDGRLQLSISGCRSERGAISVLLFDREEAFADADTDRAAAQAMVDVAGGGRNTVVALSGLRLPQVYAALILHDENKNGRMDTSFGFPTEGFGATNNPRVGFRAPRWKECCFRLPSVGAKSTTVPTIEIKVVYLVR